MKGKIVPETMLIIFLLIVLTGAVGIQPAKVSGANYNEGVDVSHNQGVIDWTKVYNAGKRFAFAKATEGGTPPPQVIDPQFVNNMKNGRSAGLLMGAFHYARADTHSDDPNDPVDEANFFVSVAKDYLSYGLPPALDLAERENDGLGWPYLSNWASKWMETVRTLTGRESIMYLNKNFASNLDEALTKYKLWIAWPLDGGQTGDPQTGKWTSWVYWQYAWHGRVDGIGGGTIDVDLDKMQSGVGGVVIPVDKFGLLAHYIGLASTTIIGAVATVVYVRRAKRREEKQ